MGYTATPSYVANGELVDAIVINRVPQQLQGNTDYLLDLFNTFTSKAANIYSSAVCSTTVNIGSPVWWNNSNSRFEPAQAGVNQDVYGICLDKPTTISCDVVLAGYATVNFAPIIDGGGAIQAGRYYLSSATAGNVTQTRYSTNIVPVFISDGAGNIYVQPQDHEVPTTQLLAFTGNTVDALTQIFTKTYASGILGVGTIKNTGGSNSLTIRETGTDAFGITDFVETVVAHSTAKIIEPRYVLNTATPPYTNYTVSLKSTSPGNATAYNIQMTMTQI